MKDDYKMAYACLECCKSFKRAPRENGEYRGALVCPNCGGVAHNFGLKFKAPKVSDKKQWEKVRFLYEHGFRFQTIHISLDARITAEYPRTLEDAKDFVVKYKDHARFDI